MKIKTHLLILSGLLLATPAIAHEKQAFELMMAQTHKTTGAFRWIRPQDVPRVMILRSTPQLLQRLGPVSQPSKTVQIVEPIMPENKPIQLSDVGEIPYTNPELLRSPIP